MPAASLYTDDLFNPISAEQPAGADLRWSPDWDRIREARRFDDSLETGKWEKRERKTADWRQVQELATTLLRERTKDLQLAMWLTEAHIKLHGLAGLRDGLRITRELMVRFWDRGIYPTMEDGPEDRSGPFEWLNSKLVDSIVAIPITMRGDGGRDFSLIDFQDARRTGSEASCATADGEIDAKKKKDYDQAIASGHISMEMFERAVKETKRSSSEELSATFDQTYDEFKALEKTIDEKFGDTAPNLSACRTALSEMKQAVQDILESKRKAEPDKPAATDIEVNPAGSTESAQASAEGAFPVSVRSPLLFTSPQEGQATMGATWPEVEAMIRSGQVEKALSEMTRLAAGETSGRSRFQRKLLLVEVCLASRRDRLARSILEELTAQIDDLHLESWESSELIAGVWNRFIRLLKAGGDPSDLERAGKLYERLCRLDPWQALGSAEG
jgi:type VI secretion system protein ImpA